MTAQIIPIRRTQATAFNTHKLHGCDILSPFRYRSTKAYDGSVIIVDSRHGYKLYVPAEEAPSDLQRGRYSQHELASYFTIGATITNASGRVGFLCEGGRFEHVQG